MESSKYTIRIDSIGKNEWNDLITRFLDASIYQSWASDGVSQDKGRLSHILAYENDTVVGCCQIKLKQLSMLGFGIAEIKWGPLCTRKGNILDRDVLSYLIRFIKAEYAVKRGYMLRIWPHVIGEHKQFLKDILDTEGFLLNTSERPYRTFFVDLTQSLDNIRKNFSQKWRNCLNKSEKNDLKITAGTTDDLFKVFIDLGKEMVARKNLTQKHINTFEEFRRMQRGLPDSLKMQIMICEASDKPISATVISTIGDTGIYLLGASGEKALTLNASYLLQWQMIKWMKDMGIKKYDLGAFNPQLNPGVYHFKAGLAGKMAWEETFLGEYYGCFSLRGRLTRFLLNSTKKLQGKFNK